MPESWHAYQGGLHTECGTNPRERCMLVATKWEQWRRHLSPFEAVEISSGSSDRRDRAREFCVFLVYFQSCFGPYCAPTSPFWNGDVYSVSMSEVCDLFFLFYRRWVIAKSLSHVSEEALDFGRFNRVRTVKKTVKIFLFGWLIGFRNRISL